MSVETFTLAHRGVGIEPLSASLLVYLSVCLIGDKNQPYGILVENYLDLMKARSLQLANLRNSKKIAP